MALQLELEKLQKENARLQKQLDRVKAQREITGHLSERHLQIMKLLNMMTYATSLKSTPLYCQGAVREITSYEESDFLNGVIRWEQLIHPEDLHLYEAERQKFIEGKEAPRILEYRIISGDGQIRWLNDMAVLGYDNAGQIMAIEGLIINVTRRKTAEEKLLERQAHLDSILNSVQDVIWSVTPDTFELLYINPAAEKIYGYPREDFYKNSDTVHHLILGHNQLLLNNFFVLLQRGWFEAEFSIASPDGKKRWLHRRAHFAHDAHGVAARIDGIDTDITERKQAEDTLRYISLHDSLTSLYNRFFFEEEMQRLDNGMEKVGLIVCDVDGLKIINDNLGHEAGDQLLVQCARILKSCFREDDIISRIGGDEFTVLLKNYSAQKLDSGVARLRQAIINYNSSHPCFPLSISIGQAVKSSPNVSMSEVFKQADNMMYVEKPANHQRFLDLYRTL